MKHTLSVLLLLLAWNVAANKVDNFALIDHVGDAHELYYYSDAEAVVLMVQGNGCALVRAALPDYRALRERFQDENVVFAMLNSNLQDTRDAIAAEAEEWDIDFPILMDETQLVGMDLELTRTAEMFVIDTDGWSVAFRGPINDRFEYERQRETAEQEYVADAITAVLAGEAPAVNQVEAKGCLINFPDRENDATEISYNDDIVPILAANCMGCHTEGGIGPFAMSSYEMVRGFSPMMREVLRTRRMPPWHADPHIGEWKNDRSISNQEKQTLVRWIEAGSPRGEGEDSLKTLHEPIDEWPLGPPDYVVEFPSFEVQASGTVDYQYFEVDNEMIEGRWLKSIAFVPGDARVVHHVLMGTVRKDRPVRNRGTGWDQFIGGYAPGLRAQSDQEPKDAGVWVDHNTRFRAQMHYTPIGKAVTDATKVGLYFFDEKPPKLLHSGVVLNPILEIPPNEKNAKVQAYMDIHRDATLYSVLPHSHYRGKSSKFTVQYADGTQELILSVPDYDFNWQTGYIFAEPLKLPAGTRLIHETVYDNSEQNPANPDPSKVVRWGQQSWQEMLYGSFSFTWDEESSDEPLDDGGRLRVAQMVGYLDKDMDGLIEESELAERSRLRPLLGLADRNKDGGLDIDEILLVNQLRGAAPQRPIGTGEGAPPQTEGE